jgi:hypothetical protein
MSEATPVSQGDGEHASPSQFPEGTYLVNCGTATDGEGFEADVLTPATPEHPHGLVHTVRLKTLDEFEVVAEKLGVGIPPNEEHVYTRLGRARRAMGNPGPTIIWGEVNPDDILRALFSDND